MITLTGDAIVNVEVGSSYMDALATATDNYDIGLTSSIVTSGELNLSIVGTYTITYNVTDANGNAAVEVTRTVIVQDTTAQAHDIAIDANNVLLDSTVGDLGGVFNWYTGGVAANPTSNSISAFLTTVRNDDTHHMKNPFHGFGNPAPPGRLDQTSGDTTSDYNYFGIPGDGNNNSAAGVVLRYTATEERTIHISTDGGAYNDSVVVIFTEAHLMGQTEPFRVVTQDSGDPTNFTVTFPYFTDEANVNQNIYYIALTSYNQSNLGNNVSLNITAD